MKKTLLLAFKDIRLAFRDRAAIIMMLAAPFLLTLGLGLVSGRLGTTQGSSTGPSNIPVLILNEDGDQIGDLLVSVFQSSSLDDLLNAEVVQDAEAARARVENDEVAGLIIIPAGFTSSVIPELSPTGIGMDQKIQLIVNPARPTSSGIIEAVLREFISRIEEERVRTKTSAVLMLQSGLLSPGELEQVGQMMTSQPGVDADNPSPILSVSVEGSDQTPSQSFDIMAYMAPGMALLFLMFTATYGGRSILAERRQRTLQRLLTTPTTVVQIFGGKMLGIFLNGLLQLLVLIAASSLIFNLRWGDWLGVLALIVFCTYAATGWGLLITAISPTPGRVAAIGSTLMLVFGLLGGSFINMDQMPRVFQIISRITPNAWGLDGFSILALGGSLRDMSRPLTGLLVMGSILFSVSVFLFNKNRSLVE